MTTPSNPAPRWTRSSARTCSTPSRPTSARCVERYLGRQRAGPHRGRRAARDRRRPRRRTRRSTSPRRPSCGPASKPTSSTTRREQGARRARGAARDEVAGGGRCGSPRPLPRLLRPPPSCSRSRSCRSTTISTRRTSRRVRTSRRSSKRPPRSRARARSRSSPTAAQREVVLLPDGTGYLRNDDPAGTARRADVPAVGVDRRGRRCPLRDLRRGARSGPDRGRLPGRGPGAGVRDDDRAGGRRRAADARPVHPRARRLSARALAAPTSGPGTRSLTGDVRRLRAHPVLRESLRLLRLRDVDRPRPSGRRVRRSDASTTSSSGGQRGFRPPRASSSAAAHRRCFRPPSWPVSSTRSIERRMPRSPSNATPTASTRPSSQTYRAAGVNRLSFGVQSFSPHVFARARPHPRSCATSSGRSSDARAAGFTRLSVDLIYGTPGETIDDWRANARRRARARPRPRQRVRAHRRTGYAARPGRCRRHRSRLLTTTTRPRST